MVSKDLAPFPFWNYTGRGVKVAVVDSGINAHHSHVQRVEGGVSIVLDLEGRVVFGRDYTDRLGHGTAVAGVIRGKAPEVELYAVKVFDRTLATHPVCLAEAIRWAAEHGMHVVNLSLGTTKRKHAPLLREACDYARARGVIIVAARDWQGRKMYPADLPNVLGVTADEGCEADSYLWDGDGLCFRASPYPRELPGPIQRFNFRGNSFATAHLSGFVALILQRYPSAGIAEIEEILIRSCPAVNRVSVDRSSSRRVAKPAV